MGDLNKETLKNVNKRKRLPKNRQYLRLILKKEMNKIKTPVSISSSTKNVAIPSTSKSFINDVVKERKGTNVHQQHGIFHHTNENMEIINSPTLFSTTVNPLNFKEQLTTWAVASNLFHLSLNKLLEILKNVSHIQDLKSLPNDCRTLLSTKRLRDITATKSGFYYHFGIKEGVIYNLTKYKNNIKADLIEIDINIDGLPLTKSSNSQFWPIMGSFSQPTSNNNPFVIGVFHSFKKPDNPSELLNDFVNEMVEIEARGGIIFQNKKYKVAISKFICDAPAKSFVLCVKGHNAYFGCTKCTVEGDFINKRMSYLEINSPLRTDQMFNDVLYDDYQLSRSPLHKLGLNLVTQFPLDPMHLIYLGVTKRLVMFWMKGNISVKMNKTDIEKVNRRLKNLRNCISSDDFARLPRPITDADHWKATEFRQLLLYSGPIALRGCLRPSQYTHFLSLHCAIRILSTKKLCLQYNHFAHKCLVYFVEQYKNIYGNEYITHNVHNLIHLSQDVKKYGSLENFSAFKFENVMSQIKKCLRTSPRPMQQIVNRIYEQRKYLNTLHEEVVPKLLNQASSYAENTMGCKIVNSYKVLSLKTFKFKIDGKNNYCVLRSGSIAKILKIIECPQTKKIFFIVNIFQSFKNYFTAPCKSTALFYCGVVDELSDEAVLLQMEDIVTKCIKCNDIIISYVNHL